jgi:hypothetical protein
MEGRLHRGVVFSNGERQDWGWDGRDGKAKELAELGGQVGEPASKVVSLS